MATKPHNRFAFVALLIAFIGAMLQGLFYDQITESVVEGRLQFGLPIIYRLYPTDLVVVPLLWLCAIPFALRTRLKQLFSELKGAWVWWAVCLVGVWIGERYQNEYMGGDVKDFLLRSSAAIPGYLLARSVDLRKLAYWSVGAGVVCAAVLAVTAPMQFAGLEFITTPSVPGCEVLFLPLCLCAAALIEEPKLVARNLIALSIIIMGITAPLAKPVVGAIIPVVLLLGTLYWFRSQATRELRARLFRTAWLTTLLAVVFASSIYLGFKDSQIAVRDAYLKESQLVQDLSGGRLELWRMGLSIWWDRPLTGQGLGYLLSFDGVDATLGSIVQINARPPHNMLVRLLMETGVMGTVPILIGAMAVVVRTKRKLLTMGPKDSTWLLLGLWAFIGTVVTMTLYGEVLSEPAVSLMFWVTIGLQAAEWKRISALQRQRARPRPAAQTPSGLGVISGKVLVPGT